MMAKRSNEMIMTFLILLFMISTTFQCVTQKLDYGYRSFPFLFQEVRAE